MPVDSDRISISKCPDELSTMLFDALSGINWKIVFMLLLIYMIISSDVFINRVLSKFKWATDGKDTTSWGTFLQGLFMAIFFIIADIAIKQKIL